MVQVMKNFHLPLPAALDAALRAEAERRGLPATELARQAIQEWLEQQERLALHEAIATYATEHSGTDADLDRDLEAAGVERLLSERDE